MLRTIMAGAALLSAAPLMAQTGTGTGAQIPAATAAETAAANGEARARIGSGLVVDEAQYARDLAEYHRANAARERTIAREAAITARQERAYALAMADWRAQVRACDTGNSRVCKAPTPNPADYW